MPQPQSDQVNFLPFAGWEGGEYDEKPPRYVYYTIEWRLILNRKAEETLKADIKDMLQIKRKRQQRIQSKGTDVAMKVNDCSQKNIENFNNSTNIDWTPVEKQLRKWSNLFRIAKKLTKAIASSYRREDDNQFASASRRVDKRGRVSATSRTMAK
ncbi:hypothetical protein BDV33DRAFT_205809 [Aspergillus novoparasiticus]|uniref:Uncharacterized protein n=1 Tax=Aspergillus novoparasiticus TaxID=986946 RepID=A0A5N6EL24_9EURO|nr:hypothetical protein BDV33DRAFT_205809 [Aspergillus novoparasiticus]